MNKYSITEVAQRTAKMRNTVDFDRWLNEVTLYITKNIDKDFDIKKFDNWVNSDDEKPFFSGKNRFYW